MAGKHTSYVPVLLKERCQRLLPERLVSFKDLDVTSDITFHIAEKINKANSMLGIIKRNVRGLKYDAFLMWHKTLVRSHLKYSNSVWNPHHIQEIKALEQLHMRATKILPSLKKQALSRTSKKSKNSKTANFKILQTVDIIITETYKILVKVYDNTVMPNILILLVSYQMKCIKNTGSAWKPQITTNHRRQSRRSIADTLHLTNSFTYIYLLKTTQKM